MHIPHIRAIVQGSNETSSTLKYFPFKWFITISEFAKSHSPYAFQLPLSIPLAGSVVPPMMPQLVGRIETETDGDGDGRQLSSSAIGCPQTYEIIAMIAPSRKDYKTKYKKKQYKKQENNNQITEKQQQWQKQQQTGLCCFFFK